MGFNWTRFYEDDSNDEQAASKEDI